MVEGGVEETTEILKLRLIKFSLHGSPKVGKIVLQSGGRTSNTCHFRIGRRKSPAFIENADLEIAARRIVWENSLMQVKLVLHSQIICMFTKKLKINL